MGREEKLNDAEARRLDHLVTVSAYEEDQVENRDVRVWNTAKMERRPHRPSLAQRRQQCKSQYRGDRAH